MYKILDNLATHGIEYNYDNNYYLISKDSVSEEEILTFSEATDEDGNKWLIIDARILSDYKVNDIQDYLALIDASIGTVNRDLSYLRQQAKSNIRRYIYERLPEEYEKCLVGLTSILREAWNTGTTSEDKREKIQALSLAKECYSMKLDLLTNATVVNDAMRFVSNHNHKDTIANIEEEASSSISISTEKEEEEASSSISISTEKEEEEASSSISISTEKEEEEDNTTTNQVF